MLKEGNISCPNCGGLIHFNAKDLLEGKSFSCANCSSVIKLSNNAFSEAEEKINKFKSLKEDVQKKKNK